jgi:hypothetical protein
VKVEDGAMNSEHTNFAQMVLDGQRGNTSGKDEIRAKLDPKEL